MKTILLPFHDEEAGRTALDVGTQVAQRFGSYLEGLLVQETLQLSFGRGRTVPADYLSEMTRQWRDCADAARERFRSITRDKGMAHGELETEVQGPIAGWREMEGREAQVVGEYGRVFDLIIVGRTSGG